MADTYGLLDIMPENLLEDENIRHVTEVIDATLRSIYPKTDYPAIISRIDELDDDTLDSLAWQWHVDFYDEALTIEQKRNLVKISIDQHRIKGTRAAVEQMVSIIYESGLVEEWHEYGGNPYHFRVQVGNAPINESEIKRVTALVNSAKNARSILEKIHFMKRMDVSAFFGGVASTHKRHEVWLAKPTDQEVSGQSYWASAGSTHKRYMVSLEPPTGGTDTTTMYVGTMGSRHKKYIISLESEEE